MEDAGLPVQDAEAVDSCHLSINYCQWNYWADQCVLKIIPGRKTPNRLEKHPNRDINATARTPNETEEEVFEMKKFGFASAIATGFAAVVLGLAAPAQADIVHHDWVHDIQQQATVGAVTSTFGNGR